MTTTTVNRKKRLLIPIGIIAMLALFAYTLANVATTQAFSSGATGFHGANPFVTCNGCHIGGVEPTLKMIGPQTVVGGSQNSYRLTIKSENPMTQTHAGFNAVVIDSIGAIHGEFVVTITDTQTLNDEITHTAPKLNALAGFARFDFDWIAPTASGTYTMHFAGNSVDFSGSPLGDKATIGTYVIDVSEAPPTAVELAEIAPRHLELANITLILTITLAAATTLFLAYRFKHR